jgi:endonuclease/exonuclease/phosphatase family metal-dependent hydrolase
VNRLRVLSYNVRSLRDDAEAVAAVIRDARPDVVCVQEAPRFLRWRSKRAALARRCGLVVATANRTAGLLVMTTVAVKVLDSDFQLLPKTRRRHQRAVCSAHVEFGGSRYAVASVHMSGDAAERRRHLDGLWTALQRWDSPWVIGADVNETPDGPVWSQLASRFQDAHAVAGTGDGNTNQARHPHRRIDGIFVDARLGVVQSSVIGGPGAEAASDHLAVFALVEQRQSRR